jgi:hypothetical protein
MHQDIKRYEQTGEILDDTYFERLKYEHMDLLVLMMRYDGYVPRFDIEPDWSLYYTGSTYEFKLSIYGVYVGEDQAACIQGMDGNRPILFTTKNKSGAPSTQQEPE